MRFKGRWQILTAADGPQISLEMEGGTVQALFLFHT